jgi:AbrB family looped-hinge helix DNA binding protein
MGVEVLTVSSKGQISIPLEIRKKMSIARGDKLAAYASGDVIMLKPIRIPSEDDFEQLLDEAQEWAASVGYQESEVNDIIKSVRRKKRR